MTRKKHAALIDRIINKINVHTQIYRLMALLFLLVISSDRSNENADRSFQRHRQKKPQHTFFNAGKKSVIYFISFHCNIAVWMIKRENATEREKNRKEM